MNEQQKTFDFYVGGQRVAQNVPETFIGHVAAEHTGMTAAQADEARRMLDLAGLTVMCHRFAVNDMADVEDGSTTLGRLLEYYQEESARPQRVREQDGETTRDLWEELPPEGRRDLLLTAAWAGRDGEVPDAGDDHANAALYAGELHQYTKDFTGGIGDFLPGRPGAPLHHPAALFAASYAFDSEEVLEALTTYLILTWGSVRVAQQNRDA